MFAQGNVVILHSVFSVVWAQKHVSERVGLGFNYFLRAAIVSGFNRSTSKTFEAPENSSYAEKGLAS